MIVCNICGTALPGLQTRCRACSGKGIEKPSPVRNLLTPTQRRGSPDRWAKNYTTPPSRSPGSPLAKEHITPNTPLPSTPRHGAFLDVQATPGADLARVYGTLLDKAVGHPRCAGCAKVLSSDSSIYPPSPAGDSSSADALCRSCFSIRHSKGTCEFCRLAVVGDEKGPHKGAHVKGRGDTIWHAHCFCCKLCGLDLYNHDHLLCAKGQPHCPTCYIDTLGRGNGPDPTSESTALAPLRRSYNSRPAPLTGVRRFAPPGLVVRTSQPSNLPNSVLHSSKRPLVSTTSASAAQSSPAPSQDHGHLDDRGIGSSQPFEDVKDDSKGQLKGTQGLYRETVRNLAKRFESSGSSVPDPIDTISRRI